ncbi:MmcQ/YjbR family DNA-binding protein [Pseudomonas cyclaminis]|uniref:MmcQ/YjbR family DNA-binding protein n=1 Tax=Pseudomonas cyclaminis TaxID=2781239 RepID=UPI003821434C
MSNKQRVLSYAEKKYHTQPDNPFHHFPSYIALRHGKEGSWYGLVMNVPRERLGIPGTGEIDVLDIKVPPEKVHALKKKKGFLPAYHMDKAHWISILLDDSVSDDLVSNLIDESFELTR